MVINPVIVKNVVQNVRAEVISRPSVQRFDPALIERVAAKVPLFRNLSLAQVKFIMGMGETCRFMAGECVFNEGDPGVSFYVLLSGEVSIDKWHKDRNIELAVLGAGACFGEMALVSDEARSASVRALSDILALRFQRETIDACTDSAAAIYRNVARVLAQRLGQSSLMLADLSTREDEIGS